MSFDPTHKIRITLQQVIPAESDSGFYFIQNISHKHLTIRVTHPYNQGDPILLGGVILETGKKRGPKTDNPKLYRMAVKYDEECKQILDAYCEQKNVNKMEAARRGIKKLKDDLKK